MAQPHPRVLLAGFSQRNKYFGAFFHATVHKLRNGFIRAGGHVVWYSDRDTADYAAPLRIRPLGKRTANAQLIALADLIEPDLLCLMHTDLITPETIETIRHRHLACRVVSVYLDPLTDDIMGERFRAAAAVSDVAFATTAGPRLARHATAGAVAFVPNPVDVSVERACSYASTDHDYDFFFAGKPKGREALLQDLQQRLSHRRFGLFLQTGKEMPLGGAAYTRTLGRSRIAVAAGLGLDWKWYASDRIAQYLGAGCLTAQPRIGSFERLYGADTLLLYDDAADLATQAEELLVGDRWRERARSGQRAAEAISDTTIVARYILDRAYGERTFDWPHWSSEHYPLTAA